MPPSWPSVVVLEPRWRRPARGAELAVVCRVLHVINTAEVGGGAEHLIHLTRGLYSRGFQNSVAVGRDGPATERLRTVGIPVTVMGPMQVTAPFRLAHLLRRMRPDLLHLHGSRAGLAGVLAGRLTGVRPIIYTAHAFASKRRLPSGLRWTATQADVLTCRLADRVICLTIHDAAAAARNGISISKFIVVPNGIEAARFIVPHDRRTEFGFEPSTPVVGMIARLVPQKDPLTFIRMARHVAEAVPDARFLLVGDGALRLAVEQALRTLGLEGRLILTGFRDDVPELLATMDVVVLSSLWEGLPIVVLEAMAAAKPVVATGLPSLNEVIVDGETGILVPVQDPARLAAAVVSLIRQPDRRGALGRQGRERVKREFTIEHMVEATINVYRIALPASRKATAVRTTPHGRRA